MRSYLAILVLLVPHTAPVRAAEDAGEVLKVLTSAVESGGNPRAAWDRLVACGPQALPQVLQALDTRNTVLANWLRTAFDQIVETELKAGGKKVDVEAIIAFARDAKHQGRSRRLALELADRLRPGTSDRLIPSWLDDPEFCHDAVAVLEKEADTAAKAGAKEGAVATLRKAFSASRDLAQVKSTASRLRSLGVTVSVTEHLGFLGDWYVIGPFDAGGMKGFKTVYPPEKQIDLTAELAGKTSKVRWKRYQYREPVPGSLPGAGPLINLREPLGDAEDAVAYAYTAFRVPAERTVEFRGAADDNLTVWVNGERVFGFEEYRNGVRFDRHRFRVKLKAGVNTVLVKVCQAPLDPTSPEPNWEFLLRAVDETGKGIVWPSALAAEK
jgi:hypothetical protein